MLPAAAPHKSAKLCQFLCVTSSLPLRAGRNNVAIHIVAIKKLKKFAGLARLRIVRHAHIAISCGHFSKVEILNQRRNQVLGHIKFVVDPVNVVIGIIDKEN